MVHPPFAGSASYGEGAHPSAEVAQLRARLDRAEGCTANLQRELAQASRGRDRAQQELAQARATPGDPRYVRVAVGASPIEQEDRIRTAQDLLRREAHVAAFRHAHVREERRAAQEISDQMDMADFVRPDPVPSRQQSHVSVDEDISVRRASAASASALPVRSLWADISDHQLSPAPATDPGRVASTHPPRVARPRPDAPSSRRKVRKSSEAAAPVSATRTTPESEIPTPPTEGASACERARASMAAARERTAAERAARATRRASEEAAAAAAPPVFDPTETPPASQTTELEFDDGETE